MSKKQLTISHSSIEVEYCALSDSTQEGVWISHLLYELHLYPHTTTPMHHDNPNITNNLFTSSALYIRCDNQGALKLAKNPIFHARSKHIEIHHHFIQERVLEGNIGLSYVNTTIQSTNILTKPLGHITFETHIQP